MSKVKQIIEALGQGNPERAPIEKELTQLINRHSLDNLADTHDFLLADYLISCLKAFALARQEEIALTQEIADGAVRVFMDECKEITAHNEKILNEYCPDEINEFMEFLEDCSINGKFEIVDRVTGEAQDPAEEHGNLSLDFVEQWSVNQEGDSFHGFMYIHAQGYDKYLKIPYSC